MPYFLIMGARCGESKKRDSIRVEVWLPGLDSN
jgi:hypothetical protein